MVNEFRPKKLRFFESVTIISMEEKKIDFKVIAEGHFETKKFDSLQGGMTICHFSVNGIEYMRINNYIFRSISSPSDFINSL